MGELNDEKLPRCVRANFKKIVTRPLCAALQVRRLISGLDLYDCSCVKGELATIMGECERLACDKSLEHV